MAVILGIDPGSRKTGYGVIRMEGHRMNYIASGFIKITGDTLADKLQQVYAGVSEVIAQYQPTQFAIEQVFMAKNADSALKLGQARGVAIVAAANVGLPVSEYAARLVKQAVAGTGAATKEQVQQMVAAMLKLSDLPQSDAADALAIAICHANSNLGLVAGAGKRGGRRSSSWRQFRPE